MNKLKKVLSIGLISLMTTTMFYGCSSDDNGDKFTDFNDNTKTVETLPPGEDFEAKIGETVEYNDIEVTLDSIHTIGENDDGVNYVFIYTIVNNSEKELSIYSMDNFKIYSGEDEIENATNDIRALISAAKVFPKISVFTKRIDDGDEITGFVSALIPKDESDLKISLFPNPYKSNDTISYKFSESDAQPA